MFLKTLQYWSLFLIINLLLQNTYGGCFWIFVAANIFLPLNMVVIADNRTGSEAATRGVILRKGVLGNSSKFSGKHKCQSLFFNKVAGLRPATLLKKRLWHRCFPVNFAKFLRTRFLQNTYGWVLLQKHSFCLLSQHDIVPFQKRSHTYFPAEYFLGLICRLG